MRILGVHAGHDLGACLLHDGSIVACIEEERLTRFKNAVPAHVRGLWADFDGRFGYFPWASVEYCLRIGKLDLSELDAIVVSAAFPRSVTEIIPLRDKKKIIFADEPAGGDHHYMHALSGFFASAFDRAAVLVVDGTGTWTGDGYEAETGYHFRDRMGRHRQVFKNRYAGRIVSGLGWMYELVSSILGFTNTQLGYLAEPGKTMGLAPYGAQDPEFAAKWIKAKGYKLSFKGFHDFLEQSGLIKLVNFTTRDRALVQNENKISRQAKNLAAKVQSELENALLHLVRELHAETKEKALCMAGGVALNPVANGLIAAKGPFERVFIQPAAADNGQAIGLAYYGHLKLCSQKPIPPMRHAFGGRTYLRDEIHALLTRCSLHASELPTDAELAQDAAKELATGAIIGWFQGGSEFGPRSLGHRSILADPCGPNMKDYINARVKFREPFRPFAPSVLLEHAQEIFDLTGESPYMSLVAQVRDPWRERLHAVTHVDGTARVQTVDRRVDPLYHALISEFERATGVPVVLNTSFNLRGMPIIESPENAVQVLLYTELDVLYLSRFKVKRPPLARLRPLFSPLWRFTMSHCVEHDRERIEATLQLKSDPAKITRVLDPSFARFLQEVDGKRSMLTALRISLSGRRPTADECRSTLLQAQGLLRNGVLRLQLGEVEF